MQNEQSVEMKSGNQDKIEGTANNLVAKVKEVTGKALGKPRLEAQGNADQVEGNVQKKIGQIKNVFGK